MEYANILHISGLLKKNIQNTGSTIQYHMAIGQEPKQVTNSYK